ncbi:uncharacterized protein EMH_0032700 [Eimeria mitis]|uniref:Uncharacterized protein n=1 Tax=Eimeria mitis TaxID=44415 RepID=U6KK05_9EIME|nr:uncharacterized protein EMH_0032700 [Eimeria mitis]CDJ35788.1 hypothetical protein, conserved [Eimeria mitis]
MTSGELDPQFVRSFRSTWEDTPSSHAVPHSTLTALGLSQGDYLDVKAWIFLVARKLQFENGERAAFKACEALAALFSDQRCFSLVHDALVSVPKEDIPQILASCCLKLTAQKMMNLEHACAPSLLASLETAVFASLSSTGGFSFSAEPILAALKPRLLDDINDPRLALRAYLVVFTRFCHNVIFNSPCSQDGLSGY